MERESEEPSLKIQTPRQKAKKRKTTEDKKLREQLNKKALALLLKPASPTLPNTGSPRSLYKDNERKVQSCGPARFCSEEVRKYTDVRPHHRV